MEFLLRHSRQAARGVIAVIGVNEGYRSTLHAVPIFNTMLTALTPCVSPRATKSLDGILRW